MNTNGCSLVLFPNELVHAVAACPTLLQGAHNCCPAPLSGTIVGIITTPLPLGAVAVLGLGASMLTKVLTFSEAFSAFATEIP